MFCPQTSLDTRNAISSPGSGFGLWPSGAQGGPTIDLFGQVPARANLSARQAKEVRLMTSGTFGRSGSTLSSSAALASSLVSRLKQRLSTAGSTLFKLTWKESATPSRRSVFLLRASVRRTSDNDCGSWPTTRANDAEKRGAIADDPRNGLVSAVNLAGWPTASARDWKDSGADIRPRADTGKNRFDQLPRVANLTNWTDGSRSGSRLSVIQTATGGAESGTATPTNVIALGLHRMASSIGNLTEFCTDAAGWPTPRREDSESTGAHHGRPDTLHSASQLAGPVRLTATGATLTGSSAGMESGGQLNPAHSRWLMGLPAEWTSCAPLETRSALKSPKRSSGRTSKVGAGRTATLGHNAEIEA